MPTVPPVYRTNTLRNSVESTIIALFGVVDLKKRFVDPIFLFNNTQKPEKIL